MGLFDMFKKKSNSTSTHKCAQCLRSFEGYAYKIDNKEYCHECYLRKQAIIQQTEGQGKSTSSVSQQKMFVCEICKKELPLKYLHSRNVCANCASTNAKSSPSPRNASISMISTKLYLELSSKYPKEVIGFKYTPLEFRNLDNLDSEIKLLGFNKNMIILAIHNSSGTPYVIDSFDSSSDKNLGFKVSYAELISLMSESERNIYMDLNAETWYEYTVMHTGDSLRIFFDRSGTGPYHEETRLAIRMTDNGYVIVYEEISPMGGGYNSSSQYPFGFFKDKSITEIEELLRQNAKYIDPQKIKMSIGDYEWLIRTDKYKIR